MQLFLNPVLTSKLIEQLHQIMQQAYDGSDMDGWSLLSFTQSLKAGQLMVLLNQNAKPLGFLVWQDSIDVWEILIFAVIPGLQGKGYGSRLMEDFLKNIQKPVILEVAANNTVAIELYSKNGFIQIGRRKNYYQHKTDALVLKWSPS